MAKSNYINQERESLREGYEAAKREAVQPVREDKAAHAKAREALLASTGEGPCEYAATE